MRQETEKQKKDRAAISWESTQRCLLNLIIENQDLAKQFSESGGASEVFDSPYCHIAEALAERMNGKDSDYALTRQATKDYGKRLGLTNKQLSELETAFNKVSYLSPNVDDYPTYRDRFINTYAVDGLQAAFGAIREAYKSGDIDAEAARAANAKIKAARDKQGDISVDKAKHLAAYLQSVASGEIDGKPSDGINLATIKPKRVKWLWENRIPLGNLSMFFGDGGCGKSHITLDMTATVSTGGIWADGTASPLGDIIVITGEDNLADTIVPRLVASGAELSRIVALPMVTRYDDKGEAYQKTFSLADLDKLEVELNKRANTKLVVIDPISAFLAGKDSHRDSDIRELLTPLKQLAERSNIAVVMVAHSNKTRGVKAAQKVMGSAGFNNAVRASYYAAPDPNSDTNILANVKNNLAVMQSTLGYQIATTTIEDEDGEPLQASCIEWLGEVATTADEALAASEAPASKLEEAKDWLADTLSDGCARKQSEIQQTAERMGYSRSTLNRAKTVLGVVSGRVGFGGEWTWKLDGHSDSTDS